MTHPREHRLVWPVWVWLLVILLGIALGVAVGYVENPRDGGATGPLSEPIR